MSALGRLAPHGEVIKIAPVSGSEGGRVDRLLVDVGDWVEAGQVVAILDPYRRREAAVQKAQAEVGVARAKLAQVLAGPKLEEVRGKGSPHQALGSRGPGAPSATWDDRRSCSNARPARARILTIKTAQI